MNDPVREMVRRVKTVKGGLGAIKRWWSERGMFRDDPEALTEAELEAHAEAMRLCGRTRVRCSNRERDLVVIVEGRS